MIFPIGDDQVKGGSKPMFAYAFIGINVLIFIFQAMMGPTQLEQFIMNYGSIPADISHGNHLFTLFTSMFLHGGWMHLIGNMLFLWVFADNIEAVIGNFNFILFYLIGGLAAALAHVWSGPGSNIPAVGASGAISAVLGAYLVMFPSSKIKVLVLYFFRSFYMPAVLFLGFWILQQLISGFFSLGSSASQAQTSGVAWWAHIGGFAFGIVAGLVARRMIENVSPAVSQNREEFV
ncbi:MAG: rhomboid family intramembrane serine protease [Saprospiraceae bacterium]|jgi:membrane associated rhomboid family serine protease|nr:rhomboid family intramembrane serine protease [Saprospiraceae bacterium]MBK6478671.1 rhomboid family intramembrane serine protease [Saprospiraceae bacterium]MBK6814164.1 rhomboid family intramembrane serine protease [Saprospiraceae bacterium]MBK7373607.1 rhomboid family intramembrane serine protease [Saprospiraceae bacterium]MBK7437278.1 rhomboid family intramembrane serine protease [Saprospiraceae bacterium]